jgi:hypothetical protein
LPPKRKLAPPSALNRRTPPEVRVGPSQRWTEEYQDNIYIHQLCMLARIPFLRGTSPWILMDFRSPRRVLPHIQDYYSRKGLVSEKGEKKKAWFTLQNFYRTSTQSSPTAALAAGCPAIKR